jgi:hypothetical protein
VSSLHLGCPQAIRPNPPIGSHLQAFANQSNIASTAMFPFENPPSHTYAHHMLCSPSAVRLHYDSIDIIHFHCLWPSDEAGNQKPVPEAGAHQRPKRTGTKVTHLNTTGTVVRKTKTFYFFTGQSSRFLAKTSFSWFSSIPKWWSSSWMIVGGFVAQTPASLEETSSTFLMIKGTM